LDLDEHRVGRYQILQQLQLIILFPLYGTANIEGTHFPADRVPHIEFTEASQMIVQRNLLA
jgi:hypothetical protein